MNYELTKYAKVNFLLPSLNDRCHCISAKNKTLKQKNSSCSSPFCNLGALEEENIVERSISDNRKLYFIIYRSSFRSQKIRPFTGPRCIMGLR